MGENGGMGERMGERAFVFMLLESSVYSPLGAQGRAGCRCSVALLPSSLDPARGDARAGIEERIAHILGTLVHLSFRARGAG
jgi:hypothetical protein